MKIFWLYFDARRNIKNKPFFDPYQVILWESLVRGLLNSKNKKRRGCQITTETTCIWMEICFYFPIEVNFSIIITIPLSVLKCVLVILRNILMLSFSSFVQCHKRSVNEDRDIWLLSILLHFTTENLFLLMFSACSFSPRNLLLQLLDFSFNFNAFWSFYVYSACTKAHEKRQVNQKRPFRNQTLFLHSYFSYERMD